MQNVAVLGLGLNGLACAYYFAKNGINVTIFDENSFKKTFQNDLRTSFISGKTMNFLGEISHNIIEKSGKIEYIYSFKEYGDSVVELINENMGYIVDNATLKNEMANYIQNSPYVKICDNTKIESIISNPENTIINGTSFDLTISALGRNADFCKNLSIKEFQNDYNQTALVFDISHTKPHKNIAVEMFGDGYILAVLPKKNEYVSSVILNISDEKMTSEGNEILKFLRSLVRLRHIGEISSIATSVLKYPLSTKFLKTQHKNAIFFIGDTFHTVHPVLGQGFNMSVKDIEKLAKHILECKNLGIPLHANLESVARKNIVNHLKIGLATHFFAKAFITKSKTLNIATSGLIKTGSMFPSKMTAKFLQKLL